jgi:two-component system LytT family response regulator
MKKIQALIVDDEPLARKKIRLLLEHEMDIEIIGECVNGPKAVVAIEKHQPDLLFLDVQMPGLDGFGVLQAIRPEQWPVIIFVTAYDEYALRAFEVHALDYLLKPFDQARFQTALTRARAQLHRAPDFNQQLRALLKDFKPEPKSLERLVIKTAGRVYFVSVSELDWIEAADNYVRLHTGSETHLLRETMNALETKLDPARFVRIHRSTIVNLERIKEMKPWFHGEYIVILRDGTQLTLSRRYRERLNGLLGDTL